MSKRIVITGIGVLSSIGKGKEEFFTSLQEGRKGYERITLFDPSEFRVQQACEVKHFEAKDYLGQKGLRTLDRSTKLICSAAKLAISDSRLQITDDNTDDIGVSVGCTLGSLKSISDFDVVTLKEGPRYTNPALFPNTVINSPASQVSIWHNIKGFNTTISTGFTASIDAMSYAYDFLKLGRAKVVFAGGVEELCQETFFGFHALPFISGSKEGQEFLNCPFDRRRNGVTLGEGACLLVMEDLDHALHRGADIYGEVVGFGQYFDPYRINKYNPKGIGLKEAIMKALKDANIKPGQIDYIASNANSTVAADKIETMVIKEVFGKRAYEIPMSSIKSMVGETYSASGALAAACALQVLEEGILPPTINLKDKDPECDLDYVANKARKQDCRYVLVNTFGPNGSHSCMILKRYE